MRYQFKIVQDNLTVASGDAPDESSCLQEMLHYSHQYEEDGPIECFMKTDKQKQWRVVTPQSVVPVFR